MLMQHLKRHPNVVQNPQFQTTMIKSTKAFKEFQRAILILTVKGRPYICRKAPLPNSHQNHESAPCILFFYFRICFLLPLLYN